MSPHIVVQRPQLRLIERVDVDNLDVNSGRLAEARRLAVPHMDDDLRAFRCPWLPQGVHPITQAPARGGVKAIALDWFRAACWFAATVAGMYGFLWLAYAATGILEQ